MAGWSHRCDILLRLAELIGHQEIFPKICCDDGTLSDDSILLDWYQNLDDAAMQVGKPLRIGNKLKRWYQDAGFEDVHEQVYKVPLNPWPTDPHLKHIGEFSEMNLLDGLQAISMAPRPGLDQGRN